MAAPVFVEGKVVAFAAAVAHHSDVGGRVPGSESGDCTSIYQEGIRVPPVRMFQAGDLRRDVLEMFLLNSRTPHYERRRHLRAGRRDCRGTQRMREMYVRTAGRSLRPRLTKCWTRLNGASAA
ncbi:MAG: hydantoinase B/oxoprolinase family protein [Betaproteobacteria bacterium]|nr:hydantoinase B/oxoprolinase family protein [Betaproteobacteria bacterium]